MNISLIIAGYGNVSKNLIKLIHTKKHYIKDVYNLNIKIISIIGSKGQVYDANGINLERLLYYGTGSEALINYAYSANLKLTKDFLLNGDVHIEACPTDIKTGEPGLSYALEAFNNNMHVIFASKGALVSNYSLICQKSKEKGVKINFSGAAGAALPTLDLAINSLAGIKINAIKGILNGTSNYILTSMTENNISFEEALIKAQTQGIAEKNYHLDVSGYDTACKLLLITNKTLNKNFNIKDVEIKGIDTITKDDLLNAKKSNHIIKLLGETKISDEINLLVKPTFIKKINPLAAVNYNNKAIVFETEEMGDIFCSGGASNPMAAAASVLKDIINIYRSN